MKQHEWDTNRGNVIGGAFWSKYGDLPLSHRLVIGAR